MTTVLTAVPDTDRPTVPLATKLFALAACFAVGLRLDLAKGVTPGLVVMVLLGPVWWPQLRTSRVARTIVVLTALSLVAGLVLAWWVANTEVVDSRIASTTAGNITVAFAGFVVLLWARTVVPVSAAVAALAVGILAYGTTLGGLAVDDPWKFALARPVAVLVLVAVAWSARRAGHARPVLAVVALLALALVGVMSDARSEAGFLVLAAVLVVWQAVFVGGHRRLRAASPVLLIAVLGAALYSIATQLFVSGALGADIQERSTAQIDASGSLLLGGRPEWSATVQLMADQPWGHGLGVLADSHDVQLALNGFASINADPASGFEGYVANYMMSNGFHLHSVAADLWAYTGPVGLLLALCVAAVMLWSLSASLAVGRAEPVLIYAAMVVCWDIAFSPLTSSVTELVLGIFLGVISLEHVRSVRAHQAAEASTATGEPRSAPPRGAAAAGPAARVAYGARALPSSPEPNGGRRGLH